jgi:hypothetical protein
MLVRDKPLYLITETVHYRRNKLYDTGPQVRGKKSFVIFTFWTFKALSVCFYVYPFHKDTSFSDVILVIVWFLDVDLT